MGESVDVRDYFERIIEERAKTETEREKSINERFAASEKAVQAALAAAEKAVTTALISAEKAVDKAEAAQLRVNETQNEFRGTLRDQASALMPRSETELMVKDLRSQIEAIRGSRREGIGASTEVIYRFASILVAAVGVIVAAYIATH